MHLLLLFLLLMMVMFDAWAQVLNNKDPLSFSLLTYAWVVGVAAAGGIANFVRKVNLGEARPFNLVEMIGEMFTAGFVGIITFWLLEAISAPPLLSAALIAICGHMGSRALFLLEKTFEATIPRFIERVLNIKIGNGGDDQ